MRTLRLVPFVLVASLALAACGDDGDEPAGAEGQTALERSGPLPSYTLPQADRALEVGAGLELVRTGGGAGEQWSAWAWSGSAGLHVPSDYVCSGGDRSVAVERCGIYRSPGLAWEAVDGDRIR